MKVVGTHQGRKEGEEEKEKKERHKRKKKRRGKRGRRRLHHEIYWLLEFVSSYR